MLLAAMSQREAVDVDVDIQRNSLERVFVSRSRFHRLNYFPEATWEESSRSRESLFGYRELVLREKDNAEEKDLIKEELKQR